MGVFIAVHLVFGTVRKSYIHPSIYTNESCLFVFDRIGGAIIRGLKWSHVIIVV